MTKQGLISIIIPTYNRAYLLGDTLDSIINQSYQNWECVVVDDSSTDETEQLMEKYLNSNTQISFITNKGKKGAPGARNSGVLASKGEYLYFFDSDNLMKPEALKELVDAITESKADVCACYADVVNDSGNIISTFKWNSYGSINEQLLSGATYVDYNISLIRKTAFNSFGKTDEDCPSFQEWDTHLALSQFCTYHTIPKSLVSYYKRSKGTISSDERRTVDGFLYILKKHKDIFLKHPDSFKKQGGILLKTALLTNDVAFISKIKNEIIDLIPGFRTYLRVQRLKTIVDFLRK